MFYTRLKNTLLNITDNQDIIRCVSDIFNRSILDSEHRTLDYKVKTLDFRLWTLEPGGPLCPVMKT